MHGHDPTQAPTSRRDGFERQRLEWTARWGALTLDSAWSSESLVTSANATYRDWAALLEHAGGFVRQMPADACYYSYHSGRGVDRALELRSGDPRATGCAPWGREIAGALTANEERTLLQDAALRDIAGAIEAHGIEASFPALQRGLQVAGSRPELMHFAP